MHQKASQYILFVNMALTLPAIFTSCFLGSWSDKRGRKGPMVVASIGSSLDALIILVAIYWKLPIFVFMIGMDGILFSLKRGLMTMLCLFNIQILCPVL